MTGQRLLAAVCGVTLMAAVPALAQTASGGAATPGSAPSAGMSGSSMGAPPATSTPSGHSTGSMTGNSGMANRHGTADSMDRHDNQMSSGMQDERNTTHANRQSMHGSNRSDDQTAAVDRLNERSLDAARQGKEFSASGSGGSSDMMGGSSSGSMSTMPHGSGSGGKM